MQVPGWRHYQSSHRGRAPHSLLSRLWVERYGGDGLRGCVLTSRITQTNEKTPRSTASSKQWPRGWRRPITTTGTQDARILTTSAGAFLPKYWRRLEATNRHIASSDIIVMASYGEYCEATDLGEVDRRANRHVAFPGTTAVSLACCDKRAGGTPALPAAHRDHGRCRFPARPCESLPALKNFPAPAQQIPYSIMSPNGAQPGSRSTKAAINCNLFPVFVSH